MMKRGVDFSQHGGELSADTVKAWVASGVEFAIVQYSTRMSQHLEALKAGGMPTVEAYTYLFWSNHDYWLRPVTRVANTINRLKNAGYADAKVWLDCEDTDGEFEFEQLDLCVNYCTEYNVPKGIYTAGWWWRPNTANSTKYSNLDLWDAYYLVDNLAPARMEYEPSSLSNWRPYPETHRLGPYGGWKQPHTWQWHNTTTYAGHSVDMNVRQRVGSTMWIPYVREGHNVTLGAVHRDQFPGLPASTTHLKLEVFIRSGEAWLFHGNGTYAGRVGWKGQNYGVIEVMLNDRGAFTIHPHLLDTSIDVISVLAYKA